jgi:hypothetical protein
MTDTDRLKARGTRMSNEEQGAVGPGGLSRRNMLGRHLRWQR